MNAIPAQYFLFDDQPVVGKTLDSVDNTAIREAAKAFEAEFIAQMLTFSGLDDALTAGGGDDVAAFTSFYIKSLAEEISEQGGFGLAEIFYDRMSEMANPISQVNQEETHVDIGRL